MASKIDAAIGEKVHELMWRQRVSQTRLAPILGINQSTLSKKLRGVIPWSVGELMVTAGALGVPAEELLPPQDGRGNISRTSPVRLLQAA